jgi:hypothetical protein
MMTAAPCPSSSVGGEQDSFYGAAAARPARTSALIILMWLSGLFALYELPARSAANAHASQEAARWPTARRQPAE